jgi:hypothetical protein
MDKKRTRVKNMTDIFNPIFIEFEEELKTASKEGIMDLWKNVKAMILEEHEEALRRQREEAQTTLIEKGPELAFNKMNYALFKQHLLKTQCGDKPLVSFSRDVFWKGERCEFCYSTQGIHEREGRYITCDYDEDFEPVPHSQVHFCGVCLRELEKDEEIELDFE